MRLFSFPYAGGGATAFHSWRSFLDLNGVDLCCVQLPGRETRFRETPITTMDELVTLVCDGIEPYLDLPCSLFRAQYGDPRLFRSDPRTGTARAHLAGMVVDIGSNPATSATG
jgi:surfactin synthase thioesterase subunit